jgi:hypothetical protein
MERQKLQPYLGQQRNGSRTHFKSKSKKKSVDYDILWTGLYKFKISEIFAISRMKKGAAKNKPESSKAGDQDVTIGVEDSRKEKPGSDKEENPVAEEIQNEQPEEKEGMSKKTKKDCDLGTVTAFILGIEH